MTPGDFDWAATLMERRRARYATFSPVFWRPAADVTDAHARFMEATASQPGSVALRTEHGFVIACPNEGRCFIDDFAVDEDGRWATEGRELLLDAWRSGESAEQPLVRVVTARADEPKRRMLAEAGLVVASRWWVKELSPTASASAWGPVSVAGVDAVVMPAPPVFDPGGPVCILGPVASATAVSALEAAAATGAVLAIVQRSGGPDDVPASDPVLGAAGFTNPSEFYDGQPA